MSKHTPGPWEREDSTIVARDGSVICDVKTLDDFPCIDEDNDERGIEQLLEEFEANARLIAAAPELLEALKWILPLAERYLSGAPVDPDNAKLESARAAIAKAEGAR